MTLFESIRNFVGAVANRFHKPQPNTWDQSPAVKRIREKQVQESSTINQQENDDVV